MSRQLLRRCAGAARRVLAAWQRFREFGFHSDREARGLALLKAWLSPNSSRNTVSIGISMSPVATAASATGYAMASA